MKTKKILALALCAVMLVCISVGATVAYLTANTTVVTNTFTVGNVNITLDETDVDLYGVKDGETPVKANDYKLIPNHTYTKDPVVHVTEGSEQCWVFVKITNEITAIEDAVNPISKQMESLDWIVLDADNGVYYYKNIVDAREAQVNVPVFTTIKVAANADLTNYAGKTVIIDAYAVQADGFATAAAAWAAAPTTWVD